MPTFEATVEAAGTSAVLRVPFDPKERFGRVRAPVRVTINGFTFRTTLARYGGVDYVGLNREVRAGARVEPGTTVPVELELDEEPRTVEVPEELARALASASEARSAFEQLSFSHRREYAEWVAEAKRMETRRRRAEKAVAMLRDGRRHP
jgi:hypothetical protein